MKKLLPLVLAVCLLAACGTEAETDSTNAYISKLNAAQRAFAAATDKASAGISGGSARSEDRRSLRDIAQAAFSYATRLRAIDAPGEARAGHTQLVDAVTEYGRVIGDTERTLRGGSSPTQLARVPGRLQAAISTLDRRLRSATRAINQRVGAA